jgi:dihydrofolate reductase
MRKIIIVEFMSLDGVTQAPGGPEEDTSDGFKFGGWLAPYGDQDLNSALEFTYGKPYDLLLGRKTYDIFAGYWPQFAEKNKDKSGQADEVKFAEEFNACKKYVATSSTEKLKWQNSESLGKDIVPNIEELKKTGDKNLLVVGSSNFVHTLLANDLVDEMHFYIAPIVLGKGKRIFDETSRPHAFKLTRSVISKTGMLLVNFERGGEVKTGSVG